MPEANFRVSAFDRPVNLYSQDGLLMDVINLDDADAGSTILSGQDGSELARRQ